MSSNQPFSRNRPLTPMPCYQGPPLSGDILTGTLLTAFGGPPPGDDFSRLLVALSRLDRTEMPPPR